VDLEPDDIIFDFYSYIERDFIYFDIDVNPYSNPAVKDCVIRLFHKAGDPQRQVFQEIVDGTGVVTSSNVTAAATGSRTEIRQLTVGFSVGVDEFNITDLRVRGGGLHEDHHGIEQAQHMWDLGHWDGKPYPLSGTSVVMLPLSVLERFTREVVQEKVRAAMPMGAIPIIRYYDPAGQEYV
jgi:hypothetical protein